VASNTQLLGGLWAHQRDAIEVARGYLAAPDVHGESALITMPTGTGKTGVIAAITTCLPEVGGHRLVLTPWDALVKQMIGDLRHRFWERLGVMPDPATMPAVQRLLPSADLHKLQTAPPTIYVATIAAIGVAAQSHGSRKLAKLFSDFGCVVVDEGHYEPAEKWSAAIRSLKRRTILLTATPYRNDTKYFTVKNWRYRFKHQDAENKRYLRKPEIRTIEPASLDAAPFAKALITVIAVAKLTNARNVRVIVRCETKERVADMVGALHSLRKSVVGVHERFTPTDGPLLRRTVPAVDECDAQFWVHQNKLIEGIDDPRFKVLAFYDSLSKDRAIVQQIGRVLRNPHRDGDDMMALVFSRGDDTIERTWRGYWAYDGQPDDLSLATQPDLLDKLLEAQTIYYGGAYRSLVKLNEPRHWSDFAFPLRCRVFRSLGAAPGLDELQDAIREEYVANDRIVFAAHAPDDRTRIISLVRPENSPYLQGSAFIEPKFGYTVFRLRDDLLFFYDTANALPEVITKHFRRLRPPELQVLFPSGAAQLTSVSLLNTDIGQQAPRSRRFRALAIDDLAPDLADYGYVCTIAEGSTTNSDGRFRRYVGMSRSRVNDFRRGDKDFTSYSEWLDMLHDELTASGQATDVFTRYTAHVDEPDEKDAAHILLDIDPTDFGTKDQDGAVTALEITDRAAAVGPDGRFTITANDVRYQDVVLEWDNNRGRYEIHSPSLQFERYTKQDGEPTELLALINAEQLLRVVLRDSTTMYAHGSFYKPVIPAMKPGSFRLLDVLSAVPQLETATSEKGKRIVKGDWDSKSVFGLISALAPRSSRSAPAQMASVISAPELILCTDLGKEIADFIITEDERAVFIHAKASSETHLCSASALHDVAAQAIKSLTHLQPLADAPIDYSLWDKPWSAPPHVQGVTHRQRHGSFETAGQMWSHIRSRVQDPQTSREVWLVLGNALSKSHLESQALKDKPAPEAIQVFALLQTTWGAVSQLGGRLRVFCSP